MKIENKLNKIEFLKSIDNFEQEENKKIIDLSAIKFADIFGVVSLILLLKKEGGDNNKIVVIMPNDFMVLRYLNICGFMNYAKNIAEIKSRFPNIFFKLHENFEIDDSKSYIPLQLIHSTKELEPNMKKIIGWLTNKKELAQVANSIVSLISELIENALSHSNSVDGCIFALQEYKTKVMVSIADFGIGIKESLEKNKKYIELFSNNTEAMQYIFTNRNYISSEDEKGRGNGFFWLNKLSNERKMEFFIYSRDGFYASEYEGRRNNRYTRDFYDINGTHVNFCINTIDK